MLMNDSNLKPLSRYVHQINFRVKFKIQLNLYTNIMLVFFDNCLTSYYVPLFFARLIE